MHTWKVEDNALFCFKNIFLSKFPQEIYKMLKKHSANLHHQDIKKRKEKNPHKKNQIKTQF